MDWNQLVASAPAAFLLGLIVGYAIKGRGWLERKDDAPRHKR